MGVRAGSTHHVAPGQPGQSSFCLVFQTKTAASPAPRLPVCSGGWHFGQ